MKSVGERKPVHYAKLIIGCALLIIINSLSYAQTIPVGTPIWDDYVRRAQLLGQLDSSISFNVRPLSADLLSGLDKTKAGRMQRGIMWESADRESRAQLMPVQLIQQINTTYPYGWNDGSMIPARGYQLQFSAGVFVKYKFLSLQFYPELVFAQNKVYEGYGGPDGPDAPWYSRNGNRMDMPELFGIGSYTKLFPGQSSVRLTFDPISVGLSTENLWWGPGRRNSILMGNTAPGFAHLTLNTSKPIKTYIGSFEGQIVAGRLEQSGYLPSLLGDTSAHVRFYRPKPDTWRYLSGMVLSYQPKWTPGLSFGLSRAFLANYNTMDRSLRDYFPIIIPALKENDPDNNEDGDDSRDQLISFFFRWAIPKVHAEIYGEYARNDHAWDNRDLIVQFDHTRAYTVGLRKLVPLNSAEGSMLQLNGEITQTAVTNTKRIRASGTWYGHHLVRDGYTNRGQLLGAGIGPGSNLQSVGISWLKDMKQIGLQFERLVHNEDFARDINSDFRRNWVDASVGGFVDWDYGNWLASFSMTYIHAYNYQFKFAKPTGSADYWDFKGQDENNLAIRLGLMYRF